MGLWDVITGVPAQEQIRREDEQRRAKFVNENELFLKTKHPAKYTEYKNRLQVALSKYDFDTSNFEIVERELLLKTIMVELGYFSAESFRKTQDIETQPVRKAGSNNTSVKSDLTPPSKTDSTQNNHETGTDQEIPETSTGIFVVAGLCLLILIVSFKK